MLCVLIVRTLYVNSMHILPGSCYGKQLPDSTTKHQDPQRPVSRGLLTLHWFHTIDLSRFCWRFDLVVKRDKNDVMTGALSYQRCHLTWITFTPSPTPIFSWFVCSLQSLFLLPWEDVILGWSDRLPNSKLTKISKLLNISFCYSSLL